MMYSVWMFYALCVGISRVDVFWFDCRLRNWVEEFEM